MPRTNFLLTICSVYLFLLSTSNVYSMECNAPYTRVAESFSSCEAKWDYYNFTKLGAKHLISFYSILSAEYTLESESLSREAKFRAAAYQVQDSMLFIADYANNGKIDKVNLLKFLYSSGLYVTGESPVSDFTKDVASVLSWYKDFVFCLTDPKLVDRVSACSSLLSNTHMMSYDFALNLNYAKQANSFVIASDYLHSYYYMGSDDNKVSSLYNSILRI